MDDDDMASLRSWAGPHVARAIGGPYLITSSPDANRQILLIYDAAAADARRPSHRLWRTRLEAAAVNRCTLQRTEVTSSCDGVLPAVADIQPTAIRKTMRSGSCGLVGKVPTNLTESAAMEMLRQRRPAPKLAPPPPAPPAQARLTATAAARLRGMPTRGVVREVRALCRLERVEERDRTKYVPHELDADLLRQGAYLRTDSAFEIDGPSMAGASSGANSKLRSRRTDEASLKSLLGKAKKSQRRERVAPRRNTLPMPTEGWGSSTDANCGASSRPSAGAILLRVAFFNGAHKAKEFEVHSEQTLLELRRELTCVTAMEMEYQAKMARSLELPSDSAAVLH